MQFYTAVVLSISVLSVSCLNTRRVFEPCELATELVNRHGFNRAQVDDWICLVQWESSFNTQATQGPNTDGSFDWGLFQINDAYWCTPGQAGKECGMDCYGK